MATCPECRRQYGDDVSRCPEDGAGLMPDAAFAHADDDLEAGTQVGEYVVDRLIGSGSFGAVYAAEHPVIGKKAAIKVLHRKFSSEPRVVARFVREAQAVNRIQHRNIIDIFSFGELDDGRRYLIMELLKGETLQDMLNSLGALSLQEAYPILKGVADALDAAHSAGIAHRDLKPENIFVAVDRDGLVMPKLLDFGIAKLLDEETQAMHKTATGQAVGTPLYMAPEQCRGKAVDHRADLYAFGVVIYQVLTGRVPFTGESAVDVLYKHISEAPLSLSEVTDALPESLDGPVLHLLEKLPNRRPESAGKALVALLDAAEAAGLDVDPKSLAPRSPAQMRASRGAPSTAVAEQRAAALGEALKQRAEAETLGEEDASAPPVFGTADTLVGDRPPVGMSTDAPDTVVSALDLPAASSDEASLSRSAEAATADDGASASATLDAVSSGKVQPAGVPAPAQRGLLIGVVGVLGLGLAGMIAWSGRADAPRPEESSSPRNASEAPNPTSEPVASASASAASGPPVHSAADDASAAPAPSADEPPEPSPEQKPQVLPPARPQPPVGRPPPSPPPPPPPAPKPGGPDFLDER